MKQLPITANPQVIRTNFEDERAWETIRELVSAPVNGGNETFYAYVDFVEDGDYKNLTKEELVQLVPRGYGHSYLFAVDGVAITSPDHPILAVDLYDSPDSSVRTIPSQLQTIDNNHPIAKMGFEEFAAAVDRDEVFRGFLEP